METQTNLLIRIKEATGLTASKVLEVLGNSEMSSIASKPAEVTVSQASNVWRVRYNSSVRKGFPLEGAEALLSNLSELRPQRKLQQFTFHTAAVHGNLFFEKRDQTFVGAVFVHSSRD